MGGRTRKAFEEAERQARAAIDELVVEEREVARALQLGEVGYVAYANWTDGKTFDGREMPRWAALPERIQLAWGCAAAAIARRSGGWT